MAGVEGGRTPLVVGNWKMFKSSGEGASFIRDLAEALPGVKDREVIVAPPFTGLYEAAQAAEGTCIAIAAQDVFWEREGAYTGEVSATMLADLRVRAAIVGHSERRQYFGETDEWVARKVCAALDCGLQPIVCVGESEKEREAGATAEVLAGQVSADLSLVRKEDADRVTLAYEPIWAIGTGKTADPGVAQEAISFVRRELAATLGVEAALTTRILYGGSVGPGNIDELMDQPDIDGVLVGGASLQVGSFSRIVRFEKP